jgi:hypothetical protein
MSSFLLCSYYPLVNTDYLKFRLQELQLFDVRRVKKINYFVLTTSYWLHVELGKKYLKNSVKK